MNRFTKLWDVVHVVWTLIAMAATCCAATPKQIAAARVAVAIAQIEVADEHAVLPGDSTGSTPDPSLPAVDLEPGTQSPERDLSYGGGDVWKVMVCNAEGCDIWKAVEAQQAETPFKLQFIGRQFIACKEVDFKRASTAVITIVHGEERWDGKFVTQYDGWAFFDATKPTKQADAGDAMKKGLDAAKSQMPSPFVEQPVRLVPLASSSGVFHEHLPAQLVINCWDKGCPAGERQEREIMKQLKPLKWRIGTADDDQIQFIHGPALLTCPTIHLLQNGLLIQSWESYQDPRVLSHALRKAWDTADVPDSHAMQSSGPAGAIACAGPIRNYIEYHRKYIGDGNAYHTRLARNGDASLPLLHAKEWKAKQIWGSDGRLEVDAPNAINLPCKSMAVAYRIRGEDLTLDPDSFTLPGFANRLAPSHQSGYGNAGPQPVGIIGIDDALFIWSVVSMIRDVVALLRPSVDLILPEQIVFTTTLNGDTITVNFDSGPTVKLTWLFTFNLKLKSVTVTPQNIHVEFTGSRWIKSRDFKVIDSSAADPFPPAAITPASEQEQKKPAVINPQPLTSVKTNVVSGWHSHQCDRCRTIWSHGAGATVRDHYCPKCGRYQDRQM